MGSPAGENELFFIHPNLVPYTTAETDAVLCVIPVLVSPGSGIHDHQKGGNIYKNS